MAGLQGAVEATAPASRLHELRSYDPADFRVLLAIAQAYHEKPEDVQWLRGLQDDTVLPGCKGHRGNRSRTPGRCHPCRTGHRLSVESGAIRRGPDSPCNFGATSPEPVTTAAPPRRECARRGLDPIPRQTGRMKPCKTP